MAIQRHPGWESVSVTVRFFAGAQEAAGTGEESVVLRAPATVAHLLGELQTLHGEHLARVLAASAVIVDEVPATPDRLLADGAEVDVLPPFAGG